jgi:hypothetical protein
MKLVAVLVLTALAVVANASAAAPRAYWTSAQAEDVLLDSRWAEETAVLDAHCEGRGRATPNRLGQPTFRLLKCSFIVQDWLTDEEESFTAGVQVVGNPNRFTLFAFSDSRFDPNSDCFGFGDRYCSDSRRG